MGGVCVACGRGVRLCCAAASAAGGPTFPGDPPARSCIHPPCVCPLPPPRPAHMHAFIRTYTHHCSPRPSSAYARIAVFATAPSTTHPNQSYTRCSFQVKACLRSPTLRHADCNRRRVTHHRRGTYEIATRNPKQRVPYPLELDMY